MKKTPAKNSSLRTDARRRFSRWIFLLAFFLAGCAGLKQCAYEGLSRDDWQQPERVIQSLQIRSGATIADLGAGSGYFTFLLAETAGATGKVYAVDIDKDMTDLLARKAKERGVQNVEVILGSQEDPMLPESSIDLVFTANTYHHIDDRVRYFSALRKTLRPKGRVAVIDFDRRSWWAGLMKHYTPSASIIREMEQAGYRLLREFDFLDRQSFLLFEAR
jgi:ubiquinone/menaquinone biosynthesis C-methylase UbiE